MVWLCSGDENSLEVAGKLGHSIAGNLGATGMQELQLAYATRLLPKFSDDPIMRINQNVLLYWQFGYYKSTILNVFSQTVPASLKTIDISSMTLEKIFGSIDEKKRYIIEPAFTNDVHFVVISELAAFLGRRDYMQFADTMNPVLECEKVARQTLKLGHGQIDDLQLSELKAKGVEYNPAAGELSYVPNVCVLAATRPLDNRTFTYLNKSGHFSRYHVIQHEITDEEASEHLHKDFVMDQNSLDSLKQINLKLSKIEVKELNRPSENLLKEVYDSIEDIVKDEISNVPRRKLSDIITPRLKGDLIREFVANAFLRIASWNRYRDIAVLEYSEEDIDFVLGKIHHFTDFALDPLIAGDVTIKKFKRSKKDRTRAAILQFLGDGVEKSRKEIVEHVRRRIDVSNAMIDIVLRELLTEKQIQHRFGHYELEGGD